MRLLTALLCIELCTISSCVTDQVIPLGSNLAGNWEWTKTQTKSTGVVVTPPGYVRTMSIGDDQQGSFMVVTENGKEVQKLYKDFSRSDAEDDKSSIVTRYFNGNRYVVYYLRGSRRTGYDELETTDVLTNGQSVVDTVRFIYRRGR